MEIAVPAGRRFTLLFLALLALGIGVSYSDSFGIGYYFDDGPGIARNPAIRSLGNIPSFFSDPRAVWVEQEGPDLRPILLITYALNYAISGLEPWSWHALNLILHFIAAALVFVIVRDHLWWPVSERGPGGPARIPAAAAALFFALAPLNTQPVNYLWARSALLCVTLYLGAFLGFLRRRWVLGSVLLALALCTKAIAITLPVMLVSHALVYRGRQRHLGIGDWLRDWRRLATPVLLAVALDAAYLGYRGLVLRSWTADAPHDAWVTSWIWFMSEWPALLHYVGQFLWPNALSVDPDFPFTPSLFMPRAWGSLLVLLVWVALALLALRRHPQVTFATAWFFVTLGPESSFVPTGQMISDHRPYIASSLGLSVLLAWALYQGAARLAPYLRQASFVAACVLILVPAVGFNRHRTWQWGDALRIWEDTVRKSPRNPRAWANAGIASMTRGDLAGARRYLERAIEINPRVSVVYANLSVLEAREGHLDAALRAAQQAVRLRPDLAIMHVQLGRALEALGRAWEAAEAYRRAVELDPRMAEPRAALARLGAPSEASEEGALMKAGLDLLYARGDPAGAAVRFRSVLERNPTHYGATYQLAAALDRAGHPAEARPLWEKVLRMAEGSGDAPTADTVRARLRARP